MGVSTWSLHETSMPMQMLVDQKKIDHNVFAFYLSSGGRAGSTLTLGGTDSSLHTGDFSYVPTLKTLHLLPYWLVEVTDIFVAGKSMGLGLCGLFTGCHMAVDTGSSVIAGPPKVVNSLISAIWHVAEDCSNVDSLPDITFTMNATNFDIGPDFYVLRDMDGAGKQRCRLGIESVNASTSMWVLGAPFLRKYYTVFDAEQKRVGFALAKQSTGVPLVV